MFYRCGFRTVTVEEICGGLKPPLTKGAYYHIFESKEAVLFAIHEKYMLEAIAFVDDLNRLPLKAVQKFESLFAHTAVLLKQMRPYVVVSILEQRHLTGEYFERTVLMRRNYRMRIEDIVRQGQVEGTIVDMFDVKIVALNYFAVVNWLYLWYRDDGALSADETVAMCKAQFMRGILSHSKP